MWQTFVQLQNALHGIVQRAIFYAVVMASSDRILTELRDRLARFINRRERAYKETIAQGNEVPHYAEKMAAIAALRIQLEASTTWELKAHINWIYSMRANIMLLLPSRFHRSQAQIKYRERITALITWCDDQHADQQQKLFSNQNTIA